MGVSNEADVGDRDRNEPLKRSDLEEGNDGNEILNDNGRMFPLTPVAFDNDSDDSDDDDLILSPAYLYINFRVGEGPTRTRERETEERSEIEGSATVRFYPPVYLQRYRKVYDVLEEFMESSKYKELNADIGKTVMEVGCAEFGMMKYLKQMISIGKLLFLDLDKDLLQEKKFFLRPLPGEYLAKPRRPKALQVEAYAGCVTKVDAKLHQDNDIFAMIAIELIEHLLPSILRGFEESVFGVYAPQIVIVTTPNSEFNVVFNLLPHQFRHWDHKFEWTRAEFKTWCEKIIAEFPVYEYKIDGICEGHDEASQQYGCVSQMAIFEKKEVPLGQAAKTVPPQLSFRVEENAYTLVESLEFPNYVETRTPEQITLDEVNYYLNNFLMTPTEIEEYQYKEVEKVTFALSCFQNFNSIPAVVREDVTMLRNVLEGAGFHVIMEDDELKLQLDVASYAALVEDEEEEEEDLCEEEEQDQNDHPETEEGLYVEEENWD